MKIFVPADSSAKSVGSDSVARILGAATPQAHMVRNGSRGMYWLEPLVEVETDQGRVAYGPIYPADAESLAVALNGNGEHPKFLGVTSELPWIREQTRLTFERVGIIDPLDPADFAGPRWPSRTAAGARKNVRINHRRRDGFRASRERWRWFSRCDQMAHRGPSPVRHQVHLH